MTVTLEMLFAAAGVFALLWAITGDGRLVARFFAVVFGVVAVIIALILRSDAHDGYGRHRDW
jgi:hypothetical protein